MPHGSERDGRTSTSAAAYHGTSSSRSSCPTDARAAPQLGLERPRADEDELPRNAFHRVDEDVEPLLALEPAGVEEDAALEAEALAEGGAVRPLRLDALGEDAEVDGVRRDEDRAPSTRPAPPGRRATHVPGRGSRLRATARGGATASGALRESEACALDPEQRRRRRAPSACQNAGWFQPPTITTSGRKRPEQRGAGRA